LNQWFESFALEIEGIALAAIRARYYRLFLDTFLEHGRLYGHSIVGFPADERWRFKIDGDRLVQLDITASFASIAYARAGAVLPDKPYHSEAVVLAYRACGYQGSEARRLAERCVKAVVTRRLSDKGPRGRYWRDGRALPVLAPYIKADRDSPPVGMELCLTESEIMLKALELCRKNGIPALPVHDALFVKRSQYRKAARLLAQAFQEGTGAWPTIKASDLFSPDEKTLLGAMGVGPVVEIYRSGDGSKNPWWSNNPEQWLVSYRQSRGDLDANEQSLARRVWRAWELNKGKIPSEPPWPPSPSLLENLLIPLASLNGLMTAAGISPKDITAALRRMVRLGVRVIPSQKHSVISDDLEKIGVSRNYWN
jgi:hypothetical protein